MSSIVATIKKLLFGIDVPALYSNGIDVLIGKMPYTYFVAPKPFGNNAADGKTMATPKETIVAAHDLLPAGGGSIIVANGSKWSNGTEGGGVTDRQPIRRTVWSQVPPGWRKFKPINFFGIPTVSPTMSKRPLALLDIVTTGRLDPAVHMAGQNYGDRWENIGISGFPVVPWMIGVDFPRNTTTGALNDLGISSATRASGVTTLTASMYSYPIVSAHRTSGVVTLTIDCGNDNKIPMPFGQHVRIVGSPSGSFANGTKTNTVSMTRGAAGRCVVQYLEAGADTGETDMTGATVRTPCVMPGDITEWISTSAEFPSTQYRVTGMTIVNDTTCTIVLIDPYGGSGGRSAGVTVANPGTYLPHDPGNNAVALFEMVNCWSQVGGTDSPDDTVRGPGFRQGATAAGHWQYYTDCNFGGYALSGVNACLDPDREASMLFHGGSGTPTGAVIKTSRPFEGGIRWYGLTGGEIAADDVVSDITPGGTAPPCIYVLPVDKPGAANFKGTFHNIQTADSGNNARAVKIAAGINRRAMVMIGHVWGVEGPHTVVSEDPYGTVTKSLFARGGQGFWDGGLAAEHPGFIELGGPHYNRYRNQVQDSSHWAISGTGTLTAGQTGKHGSPTAVKVTVSATEQVNVMNAVTADPDTGVAYTHQVGDRWFFSFLAKVNNPGDPLPTALIQSTPVDDLQWDGLSRMNITGTHTGSGWVIFRGSGTLTKASGTPSILAAITVTNTCFVDRVAVIRSPLGEIDDDGWADYIMNYVPADFAVRKNVVGLELPLQTTSRVVTAIGTGTVASNKLTCDGAGNYYPLPGAPDIKYIDLAVWPAGSTFKLGLLNGAILRHNAGAVPGGSANVKLAAAADLTVGAGGQRVNLTYDGTNWVDG